MMLTLFYGSLVDGWMNGLGIVECLQQLTDVGQLTSDMFQGEQATTT